MIVAADLPGLVAVPVVSPPPAVPAAVDFVALVLVPVGFALVPVGFALVLVDFPDSAGRFTDAYGRSYGIYLCAQSHPRPVGG